MLFDSRLFLYGFLPLTVAVFYFFSARRWMVLCYLWLIAASFYFYGHWNRQHLLLLFLSIGVNYGAARMLEITRRPRSWLTAGILFNLLLLGYFKYRDFLLANLHSLTGVEFILKPLALPLGISFYTFTQIAYLVDIHQKKTRGHSLLDYTLFVVFFPHLVAGPIVHYSHVMPQFASLRKRFADPSNLFRGAFYFILGLSQKVLLADPLHAAADSGFSAPAALAAAGAWKAILAYTFQIYFDFAGYSNMAIGLALLFNIRFPVNFNSPYQADSIIEFWRRWHITLSEFLKNYVYIPLGGNRKGELRRYGNLFLTMLIGGIWHGASWTFVIWGGYHGILLGANHLTRRSGFSLPRGVAKGLTFIAVAYGWIYFKASGFSQALQMQTAAAGANGWGLESLNADAGLWIRLLLTGGIAFLMPNVQQWESRITERLVFWTVFLSILFSICFISISRSGVPNVFLYWQF